MSKIAIYARVSTLLLQDFERQIDDLKRIVIQHKRDSNESFDADKDIEIYAEKISGFKKNTARVELTKLLTKIENDPTSISGIYISEISRLGRDPSDTRRVIDRLTDLNVPVYIDTIKQFTIENGKRNSTMNIILQVLMEFAAAEAEQTKTRMKSGKLNKVLKGRTAGNNQAYGYIADAEKMLVKNPLESPVVELIFELYSQGKGTQVIADTLNNKKIPTRLAALNSEKTTISFEKTGIVKDRSSIKWDGNTILQMLKNTIYKGERIFKGHTIKIEAIIREDLFDECNRIIKTKTHRNYLTSYEYLLRNILVCGCCGKKYIGKYSPVKNGDKVYKCTSYLPSSSIPKCGQLSINISQIESIIYNIIINAESLLKFLDNPADIKKQVEAELESLQQQLLNEEEDLINNQIIVQKLIDVYTTSNTYLKEVYQKNIDKVSKDIDANDTKIELIKSNILSNKLTLSKYDEKAATTEMLINAKNNRPELTSIFRQFIDKIIIYNFNKQFSFITIFIKINGVVQKKTLKVLIDLKGVKAVRVHSKKYFKYIALTGLVNDPVFKDNIMMVDKEEILAEFESIYKYASNDTIGFNPNQLIEVPKENYLYVLENEI